MIPFIAVLPFLRLPIFVTAPEAESSNNPAAEDHNDGTMLSIAEINQAVQDAVTPPWLMIGGGNFAAD